MALVYSGKCASNSTGWSPRRSLGWLIDRLQAWRRASAERCYLAGLSDGSLKDLGLSRHDVDPDAMSRDRFW
jgi:uncharacterized protein YjiS (DUF1127 family)